jgi:hypothetical protein
VALRDGKIGKESILRDKDWFDAEPNPIMIGRDIHNLCRSAHRDKFYHALFY